MGDKRLQCKCRNCREFKRDPRWPPEDPDDDYPHATGEDMLCDFCRLNCRMGII